LVQSVPTYGREGGWFELVSVLRRMHFVYILQNEKDASFYVGRTQDVDERLVRHNEGRERYTKLHCPWKVVHLKSYESRLEAVRREREIKKKKSRKYILSLVRPGS
jgi:putative endonuclease